MTRFLTLALSGAAALAVSPAAAHVGAHGVHGASESLAAGVLHPLFGLDHVLAMVAVGLWAAQVGGRALWMVPAAFVAAMTAGFGLSVAGLTLPSAEPMIVASVVALGLLVAAAVRLDVRVGAGLAALFALFHGAAHGAELGDAGAAAFGLGFVAATAALHGAGVALGLGLARLGPVASRALGGATAAAGLALAFA
ncbi:HupE/UreJ family protein [Albimonas pacifica]|uniref:Urease accessory protein n=1 Tax=Albimonas pacifica TaxID=1114924 RepID=A0A1I3DU82_9RHOB|nr:HupE/UreJ family protein [Albimonas pacifica]SFH90307.1 urease accessory protein [Albimonas pacifica]